MPLKSAAPELSDTANHVDPAFAVTTTATGEVFVATAVVPEVGPSVEAVLAAANDCVATELVVAAFTLFFDE
jgi:hypothetical protein